MARMCVIALVAASLLTIAAVSLDALAIADWRQNGIDTAAVVVSAICIGAWLYAALLHSNKQMQTRLVAVIDKSQRRAEAAETLGRLTADEPTMPMPIPIRRAQ